MQENQIRRVVIAGGGTAGWMTAAALTKLFGRSVEVTLVESDDIPTVGVGEATIPTLQSFHALLQVNEVEFMRATRATFKLGIDFQNWLKRGANYIHSFGDTGQECWAGDFQHFWLRGLEKGITAPFGDYCFELQAAKEEKFALGKNLRINYAYHLDAGLYAKFLRQFSEKLGLKRIEGKISQVNKNDSTGYIESLQLESGDIISGDLFVDCSGFRGLLIENALHTGYEDWSHWLPCDAAVAMQTELSGAALPYTQSIAHDSGWRWRIPLQHRMGNGIVFCEKYMSADEATNHLQTYAKGKPLNDPRVIRYRTGRRRKIWNKNCIAIGLSSGFIEPLESTSIHLISANIIRLLRLFPLHGITPRLVEEFNQQAVTELENVRDFIVLHYHVTQRDDTPFWRYCQSMDIPETLQHRIELFEETGGVHLGDGELFRVGSWTQVMLGQGIMPKSYNPIACEYSDDDLAKYLSMSRDAVKKAVSQLPSHQEFIEHYCKSESCDAMA